MLDMCLLQRPEIVENKARIGDWERDTVLGRDRRSALVTVVERKTLFTCSVRVLEHTAEAVSGAVIRMPTPHKDKVKTLTFDNGTECVRHEHIGSSLNAKTYFAHPYSSWERSINENTNGLFRLFFRKGTSLQDATDKLLQFVIESLNNRPRKTRGYKTANQLLKEAPNKSQGGFNRWTQHPTDFAFYRRYQWERQNQGI